MYTFPEGEDFQDMIEYNGELLVATTRAIYWLREDKLVPLEIAPQDKASAPVTTLKPVV